MPSTVPSTATPPSSSSRKALDILSRLDSSDHSVKLKALREVKNQIIGNRTKKLAFFKLGAVPSIVSALKSSEDEMIVQSAAAIGSFSCGFDLGVRAVLDSGAFPLLLNLVCHPQPKVVDAGARSLKIIYQSKSAPKYDFLQGEKMDFLLSLLNSDNENVTGLGAGIIAHSCETSMEQKTLCNTGILKKLIALLDGSISQRDASLEALSAIIKDNSDVISELLAFEFGKALRSINELMYDKYPRTRLLACLCLISLRKSDPCYLQDIVTKRKLISILLELIDDDSGQVGDDASFALSSLIAEGEDTQKLALELNAVDRLCDHLLKDPLTTKRLLGILLALANLCSKLESCRQLSLQVLNLITDALTHDDPEVCAAACICLKSLSRSVKNLSAGHFVKEKIVNPLIHLLHNPSSSTAVQVAALGAISNVVVDFNPRKSTFVQCGGLKELVELSKSLDSTVRHNAVWALRNMVFLTDDQCKKEIFLELTASSLASLVSDPEPFIQEQAMALVRNLVDGPSSSVDYVFAEDAVVLHAVGRQLQSASKVEVLIQGMYVFCNVASGEEIHKEAVLHQIISESGINSQPVITKLLQSADSRLRAACVWTIVNLTFPSCPGACNRAIKLRSMGILPQIKNMVNDPSVDVKLRVRKVLEQTMSSGNGSVCS